MSREGQRVSSERLRALLICCDAAAILLGFAVVLIGFGYHKWAGWDRFFLVVPASTVVGVVAMHSQELYLSRVSTIRSVELSRTLRAMTTMGLLVIVLDRAFDTIMRGRQIVLASILAFALIIFGRGAFRLWLAVQRRAGRYQRGIVIVGTDHQTRRLVDLFETHPESGMRVLGCVGSRAAARINNLDHLWIGDFEMIDQISEVEGITGVFLTSAALSSPSVNTIIRHLQMSGLHVQIATGMTGLHQRRVRTLPVAYEPMLYVERWSLSRSQIVMKRIFDAIVSLLLLILTAPLMAAIAIAVRLDSEGPVFFRQKRVGYRGREFPLLKFRTMVVDAEVQLAKLMAENERSGPLFKMDRDPRVTRIGGFLRLSSLDELPQLFNVLRGDMSLVGPRPALRREVDAFPAALRARQKVPPGITGLWQVEARDNPSFEAYSRLDLFYVDNWSIALDIVILLGTVEQIVGRVLFRGQGQVPTKPPEGGGDERAELSPVTAA